MSNVYVATSFKNIPEAQAVMQALRNAGHVISHDWTHELCDPSWPLEQQREYMERCGSNDYLGVVNADALVLINHELSRDAMAEFGIALGADDGKRVFVLYPERRPSVFFHLADATCTSVAELIERLK